jgi:serine/threonine protein kinase
MPIALEIFLKQLAESGVISSGTLDDFIPPKAQPKDAQELARRLVQSRHLTQFQAQEIYAGRAKSLILGNYTLVDRIGAGGMGQVFKAEHRRMKRVVAIKMLPSAVTKDAVAAARFQREVEAASKLLHPNIVSAFDADEAAGVHFLVMEFVAGSDLSALVKKNGPFPVAEAVGYIAQAAKGLEFAHGEGVVHRDVKPANLLLDNKGVVKILDMGLARIDAAGDAVAQAELTGTGAVMGTVDYMAPEQALSTKHADARADIYGLGCSLYYLIAGKAPYDGETVAAKLLAHHTNPIPSLRSVRPGVPEQLEFVFQKMVAKQVDERYQTMSEVVAALEQCSGQLKSTSPQPPASVNSPYAPTVEFQSSPAKANTVLTSVVAEPGVQPRVRKLLLGVVGAGCMGLLALLAIPFFPSAKVGEPVGDLHPVESVVAATTPLAEPTETWPADAVSFGPKRFKVYAQHVTWHTARDRCAASGGRLAEARSPEENAYLLRLLSGTDLDGVWLGATDEADEGRWVWSDGSPLTYEHWDHNQPNDAGPSGEDYLMLMRQLYIGKWWDQPDESGWGLPRGWKVGYICEWDAPGDSADTQLPALDEATSRAEKQLATTMQDLKSLNPEFDGVESHTTDKGAITGLEFATNHIVDISPLRSLRQLNTLNCGCVEGRGRLSNLEPLRGLPLTTLVCNFTAVADLSPLAGMRLTALQCRQTPVYDLSPLHGMPIEFLHIRGAEVSDLRPLIGMPLYELACERTPVSDLSPLRGLPLKVLMCSQTQVVDLSPLAGMNLTFITFTPKNITKGLDAIRQMKSLEAIGVDRNSHFRPEVFWEKYDAGEFK